MAGGPTLLVPGGALLPVGDPGGSYAQMVQSLDKLRWYYRFEEDAEGPFEPTVGSAALEVNPSYGRVSKVPSVNGQLGEAIATIGGESIVGLPDSTVIPDLPSGNAMSIGLWVKITAGGGAIVFEGETNNAGGWVEQRYMDISKVSGVSWAQMSALSGSFVKNVFFPIDPNYLPSYTWAFVGCVFGPERWRLYLNGEKIGDQAVGASIPAPVFAEALDFNLYNGTAVDEAFATATALTDQQWADLYAAATAS